MFVFVVSILWLIFLLDAFLFLSMISCLSLFSFESVESCSLLLSSLR